LKKCVQLSNPGLRGEKSVNNSLNKKDYIDEFSNADNFIYLNI